MISVVNSYYIIYNIINAGVTANGVSLLVRAILVF